jgi:hypothetical protein
MLGLAGVVYALIETHTDAVSAIGGIVAAITIHAGVDVTHYVLPGIDHACQDPCTKHDARPQEAAQSSAVQPMGPGDSTADHAESL